MNGGAVVYVVYLYCRHNSCEPLPRTQDAIKDRQSFFLHQNNGGRGRLNLISKTPFFNGLLKYDSSWKMINSKFGDSDTI